MIKKITFPHIGDYYIPISYLIKHATNLEVIVPPPITKKTVALGSKYSPDYVCAPFKYNLGNFIESLELGANVIFQAGGGCRYGYYAELQEQILKDLGYHFEFVNFIKDNHISFKNVYQYVKTINPHINIFKFLYYLINTILMIYYMDKLGKYPRENMGFEQNKGDFIKVEKELLSSLRQDHITPFKLFKIYRKYKKLYKKIPINKPKDCLKIGIVGELYTIMEPHSSCYLERKLASKGIEVHRYTTLTYLLIQKKFNIKRLLRKGKKYLKYHLGADGTESVVLSLELAKQGYDGIIHAKSFGCTPEINAMPIMSKISSEYHIPIIYFSFDSNDAEVAIDTRLEAFYDMIESKQEQTKKNTTKS